MGFGVWGVGFGVWGYQFDVWGVGGFPFMVPASGAGCRNLGSGIRVGERMSERVCRAGEERGRPDTRPRRLSYS